MGAPCRRGPQAQKTQFFDSPRRPFALVDLVLLAHCPLQCSHIAALVSHGHVCSHPVLARHARAACAPTDAQCKPRTRPDNSQMRGFCPPGHMPSRSRGRLQNPPNMAIAYPVIFREPKACLTCGQPHGRPGEYVKLQPNGGVALPDFDPVHFSTPSVCRATSASSCLTWPWLASRAIRASDNSASS